MTECIEDKISQVHQIAIKKGFRGKGLGIKLLQYALIHFKKKLNNPKLKLYTRPSNVRMNIICKKKLGFVEEAYLKKEYLGKDLIQFSYFII